MGSLPIGCIRNLLIKKQMLYLLFLYLNQLIISQQCIHRSHLNIIKRLSLNFSSIGPPLSLNEFL